MKLMLWIIKITGIIPELIYFKKKVYYVNKKIKKRKYPAVLVSNHTAVMDFALYMFTFYNRTIRPVAAEILYNKNPFMTFMLKCVGAIRVDRDKYDFNFINKSIEVLNKKDDVIIFPEGRISPTKEVLDFKPSFVEIALEADVPIIPAYTNGCYGKKAHARVIIGEEINVAKLYDNKLSKNENLINISNYIRNIIIELGDKLYAIEQKQKKDSTNS